MHDGSHTIHGFGNVGAGQISIENSGSIVADSFGNTLRINPRFTVLQNGNLIATNGGILELNVGTYTAHPSLSHIKAEDNSEIQLNSCTIEGGSFEVDNLDFTLNNNIVRTVNNSTLKGTDNEALLIVDNTRTLSFVGDDITNLGLIIPDGTTSATNLFFSDASDSTITLGGTGGILLDNAFDGITGSINHTLVHNSPHTIEGGGELGRGQISFLNHSAVTANHAIPLVITPRSFWDNDGGTVIATPGATAILNAGAYSCQNGGFFQVGDGAELRLVGPTITDSTFHVDNGDADLSNNLLHVTTNSIFNNCINNATLLVDNARTLSLITGDLTNNAAIHLDGSTAATNLFFSDSTDSEVQLLGSGTVFLDSGFDTITGSVNHILRQGANHTIEGFGSLGVGQISFINHGAIEANVNSGVLAIYPRSTFLNDGGTLRASNGAILQLNLGTYSVANGGSYLIGDDCLAELSSVTMNNLTLDIEDLDLDPLNNDATITVNSTFNNVVNEADLTINNARVLSLVTGDFTNNAEIRLASTGSTTSLNFSDATDSEIQLLGTGTVFLDHAAENITGTINHTLRHGPDHTVEGFGNLGSGQINLINHGAIEANVNGETFIVQPRFTFLNDGGTLRVSNGAILQLNLGTYSVANGGSYLIGDDCLAELSSVTMNNLTLDIEDLDLDPLNNDATITVNSTFNNVVNEADLTINNARVLSLVTGDFTNNAEIRLASTGSTTSLNFSDATDSEIQLLGTGTVFLDHAAENITGTINHTLRHGPDHTIEGFGNLGSGQINLINHGALGANVNGGTLIVQPRFTFTNDGGSLLAKNGATASLLAGTYSAINGGSYRIFDNSGFTLTGVTLSNLTLDVDNTDSILDNNSVSVSTNSTFSNIVNQAAVTVQNARTLTLSPGDLTNNGTITLDSTGSNTAISLSDPADLLVSIGGTGRILMDSSTERITGTTNHVFQHEAGHTIEGSGNIGTAALHLDNRGTISANLPGQSLILDDRLGGFPNTGTLQAINGGILDIKDPLAHQDGLLFVDSGSAAVSTSTITQSGGTTRVDGNLTTTSMHMTGGVLQGIGNIDSALVANYCLVSPGNSTGTLSIDSMTQGAGASLRIEVNATGDADQLALTAGALNPFGGALQLVYTGGPADVQPTDVFTVVTAVGGVSDTFVNVADAQRLNTIDGSASFIVNYLGSTVTLSDFIYNPGGATNEDPIFLTTTTNYALPENSPLGTALGTFSAYDPEGAVISYSLTPGAPFAIDAMTGSLTTTGTIDYETATSYNLDVTASDGTQQTVLAITIDVTNLLEDNQEAVSFLLSEPGGAFPGETDLAIIGVAADPDGDGLANIFELWRGSDPATPDQPVPLILQPYTLSFTRGSVIVETVLAVDDLLVIDVEMSHDCLTWRTITPNRQVLSTVLGVRKLRFYDTLALPTDTPFFVRFLGDPDAPL